MNFVIANAESLTYFKKLFFLILPLSLRLSALNWTEQHCTAVYFAYESAPTKRPLHAVVKFVHHTLHAAKKASLYVNRASSGHEQNGVRSLCSP